MANQNHTEAYDLSQFAPRSAQVTPFPGKKAIKANRRQARIQKLLDTAAKVAIGAVVVAILGLMLSSRVQLTEINNNISKAETRVNEMNGEIKRLESELASLTSAQSVEEYAESVGLRPMESGQIDYITVTPAEDAAPQEVGFWASVWNALTGWLG